MAPAVQPSASSPQPSTASALEASPRELPAAAPLSAEERRSRSFLVRVWLEPRELQDAAPLLRGSLRDLQSGDESYFTDPGEMGERLLDGFDEPGEQASEEPRPVSGNGFVQMKSEQSEEVV